MSVQTQINRISDEVSVQADLLSQIITLLAEKLGVDTSTTSTFTLDGVTYEFEKGMTWQEYKVGKTGYTVQYSYMQYNGAFIKTSSDNYVKFSDLIIANESYHT